MSYLYTDKIGRLYLGDTEIAKAYLGSTLVYQNGGTPTPTIEPVFYNYLYFDGVAYIRTNYVLPVNCSIRCTIGAETSKAAQHVFGAYGTNGGYTSIVYGGGTSSTRRQILPFYDSSSYLSSNRVLSFSYNTFSLFLTPQRFGWGNTAYSITKGNLHPDGPFNLGTTGGSSSTQKFTGRFEIIRVYGSDASNVSSDSAFDNYTPIATFRPCTYDGDAGIWHVEGNSFFGNTATSGTLTASNS